MTYLEIVQEAMRRLGEQTIPTSDLSTSTSNVVINLANFVNRAYHRIEVLREWWWLEERARIRTFPEYTTGTITTVDGDATIMGTATDWATASVPIPGDYFKLNGERQHYEISSITNDTGLELTSNFIGTNAAQTNYVIVRPAYALPTDYSRMKQVIQLKTGRKLLPLGYHDFLERQTARGSIVNSGIPSIYTVYGQDTSGNRLLYLDPQPKDAFDVELRYTKTITELSADADTPAFPVKYHEGLVDAIMMMHYKHISDDSRAGVVQQDVENWLREMVREQDAHDTGDFQLSVDMHDKEVQLASMLYETQNEATLRIWESQT